MKRILLSLFCLSVFLGLSLNAAFAQFESPVASPSASVEASPTPSGQVVMLDFRLPGIGSAGGNLAPQRTSRDVSLFFFRLGVNTEDVSIKPVASVKATVSYDADEASPTFGSFKNENIDLGNQVKEGEYQLVIKTPQSLAKLIRSSENKLGGQQFRVQSSYGSKLIVSAQELITGDIHPAPLGDNVMDINDYNALVNCFGAKAEAESCKDRNSADLDDNGVIDGTDYNLMFGSFKKLLAAGLPVPSFVNPSATPRPSITRKPTTKPTVAKENTTENTTKVREANTGNVFLIIIPIVILLTIIIAFFIIRKKKPDFFSAILRKNKAPDEVPEEAAVPESEPSEGEVDKEFFVKQQTIDENKTTVLTLTDDNGPLLGYYKGGEVKEGFAKVKGVMKKEGNKVYVEISEISPSEAS